jgi:hypothetical protein
MNGCTVHAPVINIGWISYNTISIFYSAIYRYSPTRAIFEIVYIKAFYRFGTLLAFDSVSCLSIFYAPIDNVGHFL